MADKIAKALALAFALVTVWLVVIMVQVVHMEPHCASWPGQPLVCSK